MTNPVAPSPQEEKEAAFISSFHFVLDNLGLVPDILGQDINRVYHNVLDHFKAKSTSPTESVSTEPQAPETETIEPVKVINVQPVQETVNESPSEPVNEPANNTAA